VFYQGTSLVVGFVAAGFGYFAYLNRFVWYAFPLTVLLTGAGVLIPTWSRWPLPSHVNKNEGEALLEVLKPKCRQLDEILTISAGGYLFDCAASP
jgi:hypothetical protein